MPFPKNNAALYGVSLPLLMSTRPLAFWQLGEFDNRQYPVWEEFARHQDIIFRRLYMALF